MKSKSRKLTLDNIVAKGKVDGSIFRCKTCSSMALQKEHIDRFGVPGGEDIDVEICTYDVNNERRSDFRNGKIRPEFVILGMDIGFACHSEIRPLLAAAMASKPDFICTLQRPWEEVNSDKKRICQKENPGVHCLTFRNGNVCFYLAKKTGTGYQHVIKTDNHGRAVGEES